ncbi:amino acid/amide ABC transporter substrate-binding protein (HAAT family) [Roseimicrobium gellanilyticum]|uniref:Amino acid/amide ABC transporter substrate-binding protein (HAAT family) n=1 Tax=Roseimicrobium gellanilyticum TaxID=748857 RepID=A0A366HNH6_9BACT|nr:ABC transporter substrate-binding protein [Roseimicrobium gellanilyticum]RBP45060.1 amino acid/amide ABC transporter substrate-binding protein (HAAT family) [Roseimicrobium gellanilyticum]
MNSTPLRPIIICKVAITFLFVICISPGQSAGGYKIGVILATSGPASEIGQPEEKILRALMSYGELQSGAGRVTLEYRDSEGKPERALEYLEQFSKDPKVLAVIGPSTSGEAIPLARKAAEYQLPLLALAASKKITQHPEDPSRTNPWVFQFAQNDALAAQKLVTTLASQSGSTQKIAFLYSEDGFGKSGAEVFQEAAKRASAIQVEDGAGKSGAEVFQEVAKRASAIQVAHHASYPPDLPHPEAVINAIPSEASAVVLWGTTPGPALLVAAMRKTKPNIPIYLSHGNASPAFLKAVGPAGEGVILMGSRVLLPLDASKDGSTERDKAIHVFQRFWALRFDSPPSHFAGHARDALYSALLAIEASSSPVSRDQILAALESLGTFTGVTGNFRFTPDDHAGLDQSALEVFVVRDGRFAILDAKKR